MITYIDSENKQDYTVLFNKASAKLGLIPIIKETLNPTTLKTEITYQKSVFKNEKWEVVDCEVKKDEQGNPVRDSEGNLIQLEVDADGNLLELERNGAGEIVLDAQGNPTVLRTIRGIASLNEYFQHIVELAGLAIGEGRSGSDPYFLRVPLDEPFFEINANTRGITVPGELSQVGIIGDKLAEVVFFRIDRYFDAVDLNTRDIYIEWELPDGTKGISRDYLRDVQSEKDKIIFGWVIGDELTQQVGTIRFAVRFVEWLDKNYKVNESTGEREQIDEAITGTELLYSFSSLPATISVSDSLHYSLFEDDEALEIYSRQTEQNVGTISLYLEPSLPDSTDQTAPIPADTPRFIRDLNKTYYPTATAASADKSFDFIINLIDEKLDLDVEAVAEDGGAISYIFGRREHSEDEGTGVKPTGTVGLVAKTSFVAWTKQAILAGAVDQHGKLDRTFYKKLENQTYEVVSQVYIEDSDDDTVFYEKVAKTVIDKPGHYYAIATNRAGGKKPTKAYSSTFYVPWAAKPTATKQMPSRFIPKEDVYTIAANPEIPESNVGEYQNQTNVRATKTAVHNNVTVTLAPEVSVDNDINVPNLTYQWYRNPNNHLQSLSTFHPEAYTRPTDGANKVTDDVWAATEAALITRDGWTPIEGATNATYTTNEPGCYAVKITNSYNNSSKATNLLDAGVCRVTNMPSVPTVDWDKFISDATDHGTIDTEIGISLNKHISERADGEEPAPIDYDEIKYIWHKITLAKDMPEGSEENAYLYDTEYATEDDIERPQGILTFNDGLTDKIPFGFKKTGNFYLELQVTLNGATRIINYGQKEDTPNGGIVIGITSGN